MKIGFNQASGSPSGGLFNQNSDIFEMCIYIYIYIYPKELKFGGKLDEFKQNIW